MLESNTIVVEQTYEYNKKRRLIAEKEIDENRLSNQTILIQWNNKFLLEKPSISFILPHDKYFKLLCVFSDRKVFKVDKLFIF
jgi:hypothetical protein